MVYLIQSREFVKIGFTEDLASRFRSLSTGNPVLKILDCYESGDMSDELNLHKLLKKFQYKNEWFWITDQLIDIWISYTSSNLTKDQINRLIEQSNSIEVPEFKHSPKPKTVYTEFKGYELSRKLLDLIQIRNIDLLKILLFILRAVPDSKPISIKDLKSNCKNQLLIRPTQLMQYISELVDLNIVEIVNGNLVFNKNYVNFVEK